MEAIKIFNMKMPMKNYIILKQLQTDCLRHNFEFSLSAIINAGIILLKCKEITAKEINDLLDPDGGCGEKKNGT